MTVRREMRRFDGTTKFGETLGASGDVSSDGTGSGVLSGLGADGVDTVSGRDAATTGVLSDEGTTDADGSTPLSEDVSNVDEKLDGGVAVVGCASGVGIVTGSVGADSSACSDREACSNAVANACTLPKRCLGSLARAVITTCSTSGEIVGICSRKDGEGTMVCLMAISLYDREKGDCH